MSWAEVKKFLNKRPDKSLDELITEQGEHDNGKLTFTTVNLISAETALKIEGHGRIYELFAKPYLLYETTDVFEIIVDGEVFSKLTITNTDVNNWYCEIYLTKLLLIESGRYTDFYISYVDDNMTYTWANEKRDHLLVKPIADISMNNNVGYRIVVPNYIEFKKSFEIRCKKGIGNHTTDFSGRNCALVGYKMI